MPAFGLNGAAIASLATVTALALRSYSIIDRALRRRMLDIKQNEDAAVEAAQSVEPSTAVRIASEAGVFS